MDEASENDSDVEQSSGSENILDLYYESSSFEEQGMPDGVIAPYLFEPSGSESENDFEPDSLENSADEGHERMLDLTW